MAGLLGGKEGKKKICEHRVIPSRLAPNADPVGATSKQSNQEILDKNGRKGEKQNRIKPETKLESSEFCAV